ncbi:MAG: hypothetical protein R3F62_20915 [Planctomycetota bacterium]
MSDGEIQSLLVSTQEQDTHFVFDGEQLHVVWFLGAERPRSGSTPGAILKHKRPGQKKTIPAARIGRVRGLGSSSGLVFALRAGKSGKAPAVKVEGLDGLGVEAVLDWLPTVVPALEETTLSSPPWEAAKPPLIGLGITALITGVGYVAASGDLEGRRAKAKAFAAIAKSLGPGGVLALGGLAAAICAALVARAFMGRATVRALVARRG